MAQLRNTIILGATGASGAAQIIGIGSTGANYNILSKDSTNLTTFSVKDNGDTEISGNLLVTGSIGTSEFTSGSVLFAGPSGGMSQDNNNFYWNDTENTLRIRRAIRLGNNDTTPYGQSSAIFISGSTDYVTSGLTYEPFIHMQVYGGKSVLRVWRANGTSASPTQTLAGDDIFAIQSGGYTNDGAFTGSNHYIITASNDISSGNVNVVHTFATSAQSSQQAFMINRYGATLGKTSSIIYNRTQRGTLEVLSSFYSIPSLFVEGSGTTSATYTAQFHNSTGTSNSLVIRDDNRVGILTNDPQYSLDVNGTIRAGGNVRFDVGIRDNRDNTIIAQSISSVVGNRTLTIGNATYSKIVFPDGNVGIGNISPTAKLYITGSGSTSATYSFWTENSSGTKTFSIDDAGNLYTLGGISGGTIAAAGSNGDIQFNNSGILGANSNLNWDNTNGKFIIGDYSASPFTSYSGAIQVFETTSTPVAHIISHGNSRSGFFLGRRFRGTLSTPTQVLINDQVATFGTGAHNGSGFSSIGQMIYVAAENITPTSSGGHLDFYSTAIGTAPAAQFWSMRLSSEGNLYLGNPSVNSLSTTRFGVSGRGTTSSTYSIYATDSTASTRTFSVDDAGLVYSSGGFHSPAKLIQVYGSVYDTSANSAFVVGSSGLGIGSGAYRGFYDRRNITASTGGTYSSLEIYPTVANSSGNTAINGILINTVYNASGTYSGFIRGFYYAPTITSIASGTHRAIQTDIGDVLFLNGNLGIGTIPTELASLTKNQNAGTILNIWNANTGTAAYSGIRVGTAGDGISLNKYNSTYNSIAAWSNSGVISTDSGVANGIILHTTHASAPIIFSNVYTEYARFTPSGRLGIGILAPRTPLEIAVVGTTTLTNLTDNVSGNGIVVTAAYGNGTYYPGLLWSTSGLNADKPKASIYVKTDGAGSSIFLGTSDNYSSGITRNVVIDYSGRIGVGTISPTSFITISGVADSQYLNFTSLSGRGLKFSDSVASAANQITLIGGDLVVSNDSTSRTIFFNNSSVSTRTSFWSNGNVIVGSNATPTARLHVVGSGATFATTALLIQNSTPNNLFSVLDNSTIGLGYNGNYIANVDSSGTVSPAGNLVRLQFGASSTAGYGFSIVGYNSSVRSHTSGTAGILNLDHGFQVASGTGTFNGLALSSNLNTTGTYSGTIRGFYYNPTITSLTGATHYAFESTGGDIKFGGANLTLSNTTPILLVRNTSTTILAGNTVGSINFYTDDTSGIVYRNVAGISAIAEQDYAGSTAPTALTFLVQKYNGSGVAMAEKMRITGTGVGIGTTNTIYNFEVSVGGTDTAGDFAIDSNNSIVYIGRQNATSGNSIFIIRDRLGNNKMYIPAASSLDSYMLGTGRFGFGTTTPNARVSIIGSGATSATRSFSITNSSLLNILSITDDTRTTYASGYLSTYISHPANDYLPTASGRNFVFEGFSSGNSSSSGIFQFYSPSTQIAGGGSTAFVGIRSVIDPVSHTATYNVFLVNPQYNTTGTYTGIVRGIYYNPTITSLTGATHYAFESTSGGVKITNNYTNSNVYAALDINMSNGSTNVSQSMVRITNQNVQGSVTNLLLANNSVYSASNRASLSFGVDQGSGLYDTARILSGYGTTNTGVLEFWTTITGTGSAYRARFYGANFIIGDTGSTVPNARMHVVGSGTTSSTSAFEVYNSSPQRLFKITDSGELVLGGNIDIRPGDGTVGATSISGKGLQINFAMTNETGFGIITRSVGTAYRTNTSGEAGNFRIYHGFQPTSGNGTFTSLKWDGEINQTGGANGIVRGIWLNPTLTSVADYRAIETNGGNIIFGGLNTLIGIGTTTPSQRMHIEGNADVHSLLRTTSASGNVYNTYENSTDANNAWAIGRHNAGGFYISHSTGATYPSGTTTVRFSIDTTGNVGIGGYTTFGGNISILNTINSPARTINIQTIDVDTYTGLSLIPSGATADLSLLTLYRKSDTSNSGYVQMASRGDTSYPTILLNKSGTGTQPAFSVRSGAAYYYLYGNPTTNALGINNTSPTATLHVVGSGTTSATKSILITNSGGSKLLELLDDGTTTIGNRTGTVGSNSIVISGGATSYAAEASSALSIAIGHENRASSSRGVAIGSYVINSGGNSVAFGNFINNSTSSQGLYGFGFGALGTLNSLNASSRLFAGMSSTSGVNLGANTSVPTTVVGGFSVYSSSSITTSADGLTVDNINTTDLQIGQAIALVYGGAYVIRRVASIIDADTLTVSSAFTGSLSGLGGYAHSELFYLQDGLRHRRVIVDAVGKMKLSNNVNTGYTSTSNPTARLDIDGASSVFDFASLRINSGIAVTSPNNGDIWAISGDVLKYRQNGVTNDFVFYNNMGQLISQGAYTANANNYSSISIEQTLTGTGTTLNVLKGLNVMPTLIAGADNQDLVGLYVRPIFSAGGFSGNQNIAIDIRSGDLRLADINSSIRLSKGTNQGITGSVQLSSGSATVTTPKISANSYVFISVSQLASSPADQGVIGEDSSSRNVGTDFSIRSSNANDDSIVTWLIIEAQ